MHGRAHCLESLGGVGGTKVVVLLVAQLVYNSCQSMVVLIGVGRQQGRSVSLRESTASCAACGALHLQGTAAVATHWDAAVWVCTHVAVTCVGVAVMHLGAAVRCMGAVVMGLHRVVM